MDWFLDKLAGPILTLNQAEKLCYAQAFDLPTKAREDLIINLLGSARDQIDKIIDEIREG